MAGFSLSFAAGHEALVAVLSAAAPALLMVLDTGPGTPPPHGKARRGFRLGGALLAYLAVPNPPLGHHGAGTPLQLHGTRAAGFSFASHDGQWRIIEPPRLLLLQKLPRNRCRVLLLWAGRIRSELAWNLRIGIDETEQPI